MGCNVDRIPTPCTMAQRWEASGVAVPCENNDCDPEVLINGQGQRRLAPLGWDPETGRQGHWINERVQVWEIDPETGEKINPSPGKPRRSYIDDDSRHGTLSRCCALTSTRAAARWRRKKGLALR